MLRSTGVGRLLHAARVTSLARLTCVILLTQLAAFGRPAAAADWVVGANIGNVPWEFQNAQGQFVGFEIDLIDEVARRSGRTLRVENVPFNGLFPAVQSGRIQIALSSITITPRRLQTLAFAQPYYDADQSLSVMKSSQIFGLDQLAGRTVGVDTASTGDIWATSNQARYHIAGIARYEGLAAAMLDLATGRIDGYLSDLPAVSYYIRDKPQYRIAARIASGERYSFMFAKNFVDAARIQTALTLLKQEGFIATLHRKWFGVAPAADSATVRVLDPPQG
jgi:polar amino acid transport system substrate-binding protein